MKTQSPRAPQSPTLTELSAINPFVRVKSPNGTTGGRKNRSQSDLSPTKNSRSIKKDERYEEYSKKSTDDLRKAKNKAIENMDIDLTEFIDGLLRSRVKDDISEKSTLGANYLREIVEELAEDYFVKVDQIKKEFLDKEIELREEEAEVFGKVRERHLTEIEELETDRIVHVLADENYVSGAAIVMQKEAKALAKGNDFKAAKQLVNKAEKIRICDSKKLVESNNKKFDKKLEKLLRDQENQLRILQERLNICIDKNKQDRKEALDLLQKEANVFLKSKIQRLIVLGCNDLGSIGQRKRYTNEVNESCMKIIKEVEKKTEKKIPFLVI